MVFILSLLLVFSLFFFVLVVYHLFVWDWDWYHEGGLRCWVSSFECGFLSQRVSESYFSCSFFMLMVFFVVFDLEVSLLLNIPFEGVLYKNFLSYLLFIVFLVWGYVFEVEGGYVSWGV